MSTLPIRRMILYKHGVGYFERRGSLSGEELRLSFPRPAMDDVLKSLVALDQSGGQVLGIDFDTPEDRAALLARGSIHLSDDQSLLDLLRDLRGRQVRCQREESRGGPITGLVVGVDYETEEPLKRALLTLYLPDERQVLTLPIAHILGVDLLDEPAAADLTYFLRAAQSEEGRRSATLRLSPGEHDLLVGYIAPAPAWRVSYRLLFERAAADEGQAAQGQAASGQSAAASTQTAQGMALLQGYALFDNQLEEDLEAVHLTLIAGMPVSFRYRLYEPHTPERPLVADEERTVSAPVAFDSAPKRQRVRSEMGRGIAGAAAEMDFMAATPESAVAAAPPAPAFSAADMEESVEITTSGSERGALFAYDVGHPVSVGRGQSAMVPILNRRLTARRDLLYNRRKLPDHPVASLRLTNETGLTLERGPVTVLEESVYAGEAVVPFTPAGGEVIVPFAVELGIKVEEQQQSETRIMSMRVRDDYLLVTADALVHTSYHLTSTLPQAVDVTIEHPRRPNHSLTETPEPIEEGASFARWSVGCPADTRTVFTVHECKELTRHEKVRTLTGKQLQDYLHNKFLDEATARGLQEVLQTYRQIHEVQQQVNRADKERQAIYTQQKQIQGNLGPLSHQGDEGKLRARYVAELNRLEDRLAELEREQQRHQARIAELEQQAQAQLARLQSKE